MGRWNNIRPTDHGHTNMEVEMILSTRKYPLHVYLLASMGRRKRIMFVCEEGDGDGRTTTEGQKDFSPEVLL